MARTVYYVSPDGDGWKVTKEGGALVSKHLTKEAADAYAVESQRRAGKAWHDGVMDEIVVPISASQSPDHIFVRTGNAYRAFAKYEHKLCSFIQDNLKSLPGQ